MNKITLLCFDLDSLEPKRRVSITNMHIDHGEVFATLTEEGASKTAIYDTIGNRIAGEEETLKQ